MKLSTEVKELLDKAKISIVHTDIDKYGHIKYTLLLPSKKLEVVLRDNLQTFLKGFLCA